VFHIKNALVQEKNLDIFCIAKYKRAYYYSSVEENNCVN